MNKKIYIALLVVLLSGISAGFFLGQYYDRARMHQLMQKGPEQFEEMVVGRLVRQLKLEGSQVTSVRAKVALVVTEMDAEHRKHGDEMHGRMTRLLVEIRPILNGAQQKILDTMNAEDLRPGPPPPLDGPPHGGFHGDGPPPGRP